MKTASTYSTVLDTRQALTEAYADLTNQLGGSPTWMAVHLTDQHSAELVTTTLQTLAPDVPFQGGTTCLGLMTETGFHSEHGLSLGIFGIYDPQGLYAVGYSDAKSYPKLTGKESIRSAFQQAGKNEPPALIWITCAPGKEEGIIAGIEAGLAGANTPIIGGSSADNTVEGHWYQITNGQVLHEGVVITLMYPSRPIHYGFDSSYHPTEHQGIITKAAGRKVYEIDRRPAAEVYNEWTHGAISEYLEGGNILAPSTLYPLGRTSVWNQGGHFYQLSHPRAVLENRALRLFTRVEPGEEVVLMESSAKDLVYRIDRVTSKALAGLPLPDLQVAGALIIYCAGCMLAVQDEMPEVARQFREALGAQPFLGIHTFGEQGRAYLGENTHANLMMSMIVFEA